MASLEHVGWKHGGFLGESESWPSYKESKETKKGKTSDCYELNLISKGTYTYDWSWNGAELSISALAAES